jgi:hypothetical protein
MLPPSLVGRLALGQRRRSPRRRLQIGSWNSTGIPGYLKIVEGFDIVNLSSSFIASH